MTENLITSELLAKADRLTLSALLGALLPANQQFGTPAANDSKIMEDILQTLRPASNEGVAKGLAELRQSSLEKFDVSFDQCVDTQRVALFNGMLSQNSSFYRILSSVVLQCYYRNDDVMRSLDMEPRAPYPEGYEIPQGDLSLLEPVLKRGKIWRDTT